MKADFLSTANADELNSFCRTKKCVGNKKKTTVKTYYFSSCETVAIIVKCN